jgi:3-isopropylmalate/(R)-2-methylmalate dehydratase small subunit
MTMAWPLQGIAAVLLRANIDTDIIMPKQYLKGIDRSGLAEGLFRPLRFREDGSLDPEFPLNREPGSAARILVTGPNFGCGSSREHAVWGLQQWGFAAVIGTTFGGIFRDNALNNNLLVVELDADQVEGLAATISRNPATIVSVDLERQRVDCGGNSYRFAIDPERRDQILLGQDRIARSLAHEGKIRAFESAHWLRQPWMRPKL